MSVDPVGDGWTSALDLCRGLSGYEVDIVLATVGANRSARPRQDVATVRSAILEERGSPRDSMPEPWAEADQAGLGLQELAK
jgi:hypothetical protein